MRISKEKKIMIAVMTALLVIILAVQVFASGGATAPSGTDGDGNLVITVVENIPAADIEENTVPLAVGTAAGRGFGTWHIVLIAAAAIIIFFIVRMVIRKHRLKSMFSQYSSELGGRQDRFGR